MFRFFFLLQHQELGFTYLKKKEKKIPKEFYIEIFGTQMQVYLNIFPSAHELLGVGGGINPSFSN